MPQTTTAITGALGKIEVSIDEGVTWTDISGSTTVIDSIEITRSSGSKATFSGAFHLVTSGKQDVATVGITALYTETVGEAAMLALGYIEDNKYIDLRWQYADVTAVPAATYKRFYTQGKSRVVSATLPEVNSESGEPAVLMFSVSAPGIDYETVTVP